MNLKTTLEQEDDGDWKGRLQSFCNHVVRDRTMEKTKFVGYGCHSKALCRGIVTSVHLSQDDLFAFPRI